MKLILLLIISFLIFIFYLKKNTERGPLESFAIKKNQEVEKFQDYVYRHTGSRPSAGFLNEAQCRKAASDMGVRWNRGGSWGRDPYGCFYNKKGGWVWYNRRNTGRNCGALNYYCINKNTNYRIKLIPFDRNKNWKQRYDYAVKKGWRLPTTHEIRTNKNNFYVGHIDAWIATGTPSSKSWTQIGSRHHHYNKVHNPYPSWGNTNNYYWFRRYQGFVIDSNSAISTENYEFNQDSKKNCNSPITSLSECKQAVKELANLSSLTKLKPLVNKGNNPRNLGECEGDCDRDSDCHTGLRCFQRNSSSKVPPGCKRGGRADIGSHDYCYDPNKTLTQWAAPKVQNASYRAIPHGCTYYIDPKATMYNRFIYNNSNSNDKLFTNNRGERNRKQSGTWQNRSENRKVCKTGSLAMVDYSNPFVSFTNVHYRRNAAKLPNHQEIFVEMNVTTPSSLSGWHDLFVAGPYNTCCRSGGYFFAAINGYLAFGNQCNKPNGVVYKRSNYKLNTNTNYILGVFYSKNTKKTIIWSNYKIIQEVSGKKFDIGSGTISIGTGCNNKHNHENWKGKIHSIKFYANN